ncbi:DUF6404 family protein [Massilia sp. TS11]|uniref:DUF6404 family protein n=1 Tax=Massilia sp. TS11 TaxID=2908003 RepID=UPI001ED9EF45|nr:DUF6404 family protein [Massilia sp. TS11]MCG2585422.1 DUF6404 family protein [Massilia sp. TS11]
MGLSSAQIARHDRALALIGQKGLERGGVIPPLYRLLWAAGIDCPPPYFAGFGANVLMAGTYFAVAWGAIMWLMGPESTHTHPQTFVLATAIGGACFGLVMALIYQRAARKHALPAWQDL